MIETMTIQECASYLREHGMRIGYKKLVSGLEAGAFPFGLVLPSDGKRRPVLIYRKLVDKWIGDVGTGDSHA